MKSSQSFQLFFSFFLFCLCNNTIAQVNNDNAYRSKSNKLYWKNKNPYAGYWQQDVQYKIKAKIQEKTNIIDATEELTYWNNSPDELTFVYFHLYQNAFTKGSYLTALHKANKQPIRHMGRYEIQGLGTLVDNLTANGIACKTELDNTILKVYLPKPLLPGESVVFNMNFATFFDRGEFRRRMAMYPSWGFMHYNGVHWYPRISVYDIKKGWDVDQHLNKELYGDYGLFDVELNFPSNYVVEATGELKNPGEVFPGDLRQRLDIKNFAQKPWNEKPSTITPYDSSQRKTWHYIGYNVHDFAFSADPSYRLGETEWNGVKCICIVTEPHASKWQNTPAYIAKIIQTFSTDFGQYEYPKIVAADANDGMEYPMITMDGGVDPDNRGLLAHEIGHNWFYGMIGNNETYRAALDEGFTQFLTAWGLAKIDGDTMIETPEKNKYKRHHRDVKLVMDRNIYPRYIADAIRGEDKMLNTHSNDFHSALGHENGYSNVYHKTATMLYNLQYVLGDTLFLNAMKHYVSKWKIAHPYFEDFRQSMIEYTHQDLNYFFDQWLETTKTIDYGIRSIKKTKVKDEFNITFKRYGQMQMPIDFTVTAKDKKAYNYTIPNNYFIKNSSSTKLAKWYGWDILNPTYTAKVTIPSGVKSVQIDPTYRLADVNMLNNYKIAGLHIKPKAAIVRWESYINNPLSWKKYNAFVRPDIWWNNIDGVKLGMHVDGTYMNFMRNLYCTVWFNTRLLSDEKYKPYEGQSWYANTSPIDYTLRYDSPLKNINKKINIGIDSRLLEGYSRHSIYSIYKLSNTSSFKIEAISSSRIGKGANDYLFTPSEWSSYTHAGSLNTQTNSYLQLQWNKRVNYNKGNGKFNITLRSPLTYNYAFLQGETVHQIAWKKLDARARAFVRLGMGNDVPKESTLSLQGANPKELMENKFTRSQGVLPLDWGGYSTDNFSHIQMGGGLNLRGYTGYYAIEEDDQNNVYLNYKGRSGASINMELDFDRLVNIHPKKVRDYVHFDTYLFGDAGVISRSILNYTNIPTLDPVKQWSKVRMDAGVGVALTIKKLGPLEKFTPFVIRFDMPLFLSSPPYAKPEYFAWRWVVGVNRAF